MALEGTGSADVLTGGAERNSIFGLNGNDALSGDGGNDDITGGGGRDIVSGGDGADRFRFDSASESGVGVRQRDVITDFAPGLDKMVVNFGGFAFVGDAAFSNTGVAELRYVAGLGTTIIQGDTDGNGTVDMEILLRGRHVLTATDFDL